MVPGSAACRPHTLFSYGPIKVCTATVQESLNVGFKLEYAQCLVSQEAEAWVKFDDGLQY